MASALSNPARSGQNHIYRAVKAGKTTVAKGTKIYMETRKKKSARPEWLKRQSKTARKKAYAARKQYLADEEAAIAEMTTEKQDAYLAKKAEASRKQRNEKARIKRQIAKEFEKYDGYGPGFAKRLTGSRASKYKSSQKKMMRTRKSGKPIQVINQEGVKKWNKSRITRRAAGEWGHVFKGDVEKLQHELSRRFRPNYADYHQDAIDKANEYMASPEYAKRFGGSGKAGRKPAARKSGLTVKQMKRRLRDLDVPVKSSYNRDDLEILLSGAEKAVANGLALTNPSYLGMVKAVAIPGVTGAALALATVITAEKSGALAWYEEKTAGTFLESVPATAPAAIGAAVLAGLSYAVRNKSRMASRSLLGGAVFTFGLGVFADAKSMWDDSMSEEVAAPEGLEGDLEDMAGLAFGGIGFDQLGGLALENPTVLGDLGDGFAYETAPLSAPSYGNYAQSTFGDAYFSGADFSVAEGQALLNGKGSWFGLFGKPTIRTSSVAGRASHLAGQPGHRWGWLIRTVGWTKAQQIVALPPAKRLAVVRQLRAAALATYQKLLASAKAAEVVAEEAPLPAAGVAAAGAQGATTAAAPGNTGAVNYLGDPALFMGA